MLVIETFAGGRGYRILGGRLQSPIQGSSLESVVRKAAVATGVVENADDLTINSTFEAAQVLETILGDDPGREQIVTGTIS